MNILQLNGEYFEGMPAMSVGEFLMTRPTVDLLLLDTAAVSENELTSLVVSVRTRFICFTSADSKKTRQLTDFGHFDISEFWADRDFQAAPEAALSYLFMDLAQTQGFALLPDEAAQIADDFPGIVERHGRYEMRVSGAFPEGTLLFDYQRLVANWGKPIFVVPFRRFYNAPGRHRLSFDYEMTGDIRLTYVIETLDKTGRILKVDRFTEKEGFFDAPEDAEFKGQVYIKGRGSVRIGKVWTYKDKHELGWFQMGDTRRLTKNGEFIYSYFIPGKRKERLIVGFSGNLSELPHYERQTMANYDFPVLLFCDLRGRGGAFQLGKNLSVDYEEELTEIIDEKLAELQLTRSDLIMTGWSMGSFPAMYYGMALSAGDIIAAKLLLHLGTVTSNLKVLYRTEPSMIAAREYLTGRCQPEDTDKLNVLIADRLAESDLSGTNIHAFMMSADELDRCEDFFENLKDRARSVSISHEIGFHAEKLAEMSRWINEQLDDISANSADMI